MNSKKLIKVLVPSVFYGLLILFLVLYLQSIDTQKLSAISLSIPYLLVATAIALFSRYFNAGVWFVILKGLGANISNAKLQLVYVFAKSWLGRYIPGTAPWILGKIYFASKHGISKNKLAVSSLLEGGLQIVVTMVIAALLLAFNSQIEEIDTSVKLAMGGVIIAGIVAVIPAVFNRLISFAYKLVRKKTFSSEHFVGGAVIGRSVFLYTILAALSGISYFFIAKSVYPALGYEHMLFVIGATSLAGSLSMLAIFAPGGIGVREGIIIVLLSLIMPTEYALAVAVISRLWSVIVDFLFFGSAKAVTVLLKDKNAISGV